MEEVRNKIKDFLVKKKELEIKKKKLENSGEELKNIITEAILKKFHNNDDIKRVFIDNNLKSKLKKSIQDKFKLKNVDYNKTFNGDENDDEPNRILKLDSNNPYDILGVSRKATQKEIKTNYKKMALKYHPDKNTDSRAGEVFKKINEAYRKLANQTGGQKISYEDIFNMEV